MVELTDDPPAIVLNDHLEGDRPILVYRVARPPRRDGASWRRAAGPRSTSLEIPQGPVTTFSAPGGQRLAIYELARPGVIESVRGPARLLSRAAVRRCCR